MQLLYSERSPYARKARAVAIEKQIELELVETMPLDKPEHLLKVNPASKIPVLLLEDGTSLLDSRVICEYLDSIGQGPKLIPESGDERFRVLHLAAIAEGVLDATVACTLESTRPAEFIYQGQFDKQRGSVLRSAASLNACVAELEAVTIASIATACALEYVDGRMPGIGAPMEWRAEAPQLANWLEQFKERKSIVETAPYGWDKVSVA